jgi:hypothetical protein
MVDACCAIMPDFNRIRELVRAAVSETIEAEIPKLRDKVTLSVLKRLEAEFAPTGAPEAAKPATQPLPAVSTEAGNPDEELQRKARTFAKLLVEEIKLYNMAKVRDGKMHRNLYDRLKTDIERSRAAYEKRYGQTPVAPANYFTEELVRGLADGDASLFGNNFPQ